ncbi:hypothetical protein Tco_1433340 [Tanacetum coccineum]
MDGDSHMEAVDRTLVAREAVIDALPFHLDRAQQRMKVFADRKRSDRSFKCGQVAYKLLLPDNATVHNIFHVSQLKPFKDRKIAKVRNAALVYWLVYWSNGNADDATWEVAT